MIRNHQIDLEKDRRISAEGTLICNGAYCFARFFNLIDLYGDYQVLSTDYKNYAIVYSCSNFMNVFSLEYMWILTREPTVSKDYMRELTTTAK